MKYQIFVWRVDEKADASADPLYEQIFDANEDFADDIGEMAGNAIAEAVRCDVAAQGDSHD